MVKHRDKSTYILTILKINITLPKNILLSFNSFLFPPFFKCVYVSLEGDIFHSLQSYLIRRINILIYAHMIFFLIGKYYLRHSVQPPPNIHLKKDNLWGSNNTYNYINNLEPLILPKSIATHNIYAHMIKFSNECDQACIFMVSYTTFVV